MTWLKKIGLVIVKGAQIIVGIQQMLPPNILGTIQTIETALSRALQVIVDVEAMGVALSLTGAQKLQAAVAAGTDIFLRWSATLGHKIANPALFKEGVTSVMDGLVKIANSWEGEVETKNVG